MCPLTEQNYLYYYKSKRRWGTVPRWASDVTVLRLNAGITVITVYCGKPSSVTHFFVVFLRFYLDYCPVGRSKSMAHYKISNKVNHLLIFFLLVFYIIHDAMCLNKMSRTSSRNIGLQHQKYSSIFNCTNGVLFTPVFTKPILSVCC